MKRLPLLFLLLALFRVAPAQTHTADPGNFQVGYRDTVFTDTSLASTGVSVRIYYPAFNGGVNQSVATGEFPVIAFGHGFNITYLNYTNIFGHLASWGYIVAVPDVQNGFTVSHAEFARELRSCALWLQNENNVGGSPFFQHVDTMMGVMGHSMGGGASFLSADEFPEAHALCGLAAAETNPSCIASLAGWNKPMQYISGSGDNIVPENTNAQPMYNATQGEKHWVSLVGGAHCKFTDGNTICDVVSGGGTISRQQQLYHTRKYSTAFFNYFLKGDANAQLYLCGDSAQADVTAGRTALNFNLSLCPTSVAASDDGKATAVIWPNPASDKIWFSQPFSFIADTNGKTFLSADPQVLRRGWVDVRNLPAGCYRMVFPDGKSAGFVKQ